MQYQKGLTDITTRIIFLENNWAGLTYRTNGTLVFSFGFAQKICIYHTLMTIHFLVRLCNILMVLMKLGLSFRIGTLSSQRHTGFWGY